jgi:hypothetical protein
MSIADKLTTIAENESKVYEAGKKAQYDEFWDNYQSNGKRTHYKYAFGGQGWYNTFYPKYDMKPTTANYMFMANTNISDLVERLAETGVELDFSNCTSFDNTFSSTQFTRIGVVDLSKATTNTNTFAYNGSMKIIDKIIVSEITPYSNIFVNNMALTELRVEGVIGKNGFSVSSSTKLTHDSLMSIIKALQDKTSDTSGTVWKVTLGSTNVAKLTEAELDQIRTKGWTYG